MRAVRPFAIASVVGLVAAVLAIPTVAAAQDTVSLTLIRQTPWVSPGKAQIEVTVSAQNLGTSSLKNLGAVLYLSDAVRNRSEYDLSLSQDVTTLIQAPAVKSFPGTLDAGATRTFRFVAELPALASRTQESLVYPIKIDFVSGSSIEGELRTSVVYIVKKPKVPLNLTWTWVLDAPIGFQPDGTLRGSALEQSIQPTGSIGGEIAALRTLATRGSPVDVAVSPVLAGQLSTMAAGYRVNTGSVTRIVAPGTGGAAAASQALASMRAIASSPHVELSAMPYSDPSLPSLLASGLGKDIQSQLSLGRQVVARALQAAPDPTILRPPLSAFDGPTLSRLRAQGVRTVLADAGSVQLAPQPLGFAQPADVMLAAGGRSALTGIVPDLGVQNLIDGPASFSQVDPRLGAQAVLGELATIWLEHPSAARGTSLLLEPAQDLPPAFFADLAHAVSDAPWLRLRHASTMASLAGQLTPAAPQVRLPAGRTPAFAGNYVAALTQARSTIAGYGSMLVNPSSLPQTLDNDLLTAESAQFLTSPSDGRAYVQAVVARIDAELGRVHPVASQVVTLTSGTGVLPVRISNSTGQPVRVTVDLQSPRLVFSQDNPQTVVLRFPLQTLLFHVKAQTTGTFPVNIVVTTPSGLAVSQGTAVVRSTAFSRIAIILMLGALGVLLAIWARRAVSRRKHPDASPGAGS